MSRKAPQPPPADAATNPPASSPAPPPKRHGDRARVIIRSDGSGRGTSVCDETGKVIPDCFAFEFSGSRLSAAVTAKLYVFQPDVEIAADAEIIPVPQSLEKRAQDFLAGIKGEEAYFHVLHAFQTVLGIKGNRKGIEG